MKKSFHKASLTIRRAVLESLEHRRLMSFTPAATYPVGSSPNSVVTADFNGDGRADVATSSAADTVSVLLSNANGTLQPALTSPAGSSPHSLAVGDFNGDGKRDLVAASATGVSVLLGNGNGTFQAPQSVALPDQSPANYTGPALTQETLSVAVGDLNGDGKLDVAATGQTQFDVWHPGYQGYYGYYNGYYQTVTDTYVNVLLGSGTGAFAPANSSLANSMSYGSIGIGDANGDGKADVIATGYGVNVFRGNGDGTLQPPIQSGSGYSRGNAPIADFDNDGKLDVLLNDSGNLRLLKGQGDGTFVNTAFTYGGTARSVVAGDLNNDGKLDIVVNASETHYTSYGYYGGYDPISTDQTTVLLGYGDGTFSNPINSNTGTAYAGYPPANASALGDFNGDGRPDLVSTDPANSAAKVELTASNWVLPPSMKISDVTVTEGNTGTVNAVFTVTLSSASLQNVTVQYATAGGTAVSGRDFTALPLTTLTFLPGELTKTITVPVKGDTIDEYDETFTVNLSNPAGAELRDSQGVGAITDDDAAPTMVISSGSKVEGNRGLTAFVFTVSLSAASEKDITVDFATANGTATLADNDYQATSGTLFFAAGTTSRTLTVYVVTDKRRETNETFFVNLSGATNALITTAQGIGTILDDDTKGGGGSGGGHGHGKP